jgi:PAT family beta-lactamase induction signal transducer AmpG
MSSTTSPAPRAYANPFLWVPSSYLAMGLIYVTVSGVANIMFKNMGMTDAEAARWSSLFVFPYVIKPLWAPALEIYRTKRFFVLLMQTLLVGAVLAIGLALKVPGIGWTPILVLLGLAGLLGATHDIASDGVYVTTLGPKEQARYTGVQSMCWNAGPILANGVLVWLSGLLFRTFHSGSFSLGALLDFARYGGGTQKNVAEAKDAAEALLVRTQWAQS